MIQHQLTQQLDRVAQRSRRYRLLVRLSICWLVAAVVGGGLLLVEVQTGAVVPWAFSILVAIAGVAAFAAVVANHKRPSDRQQAAHAVERAYPDLQQRLLAAVEQQPNLQTGRLNFLQQEVVGEAVAHGFTHDWSESVPARRLRRVRLLHAMCAGLLLAVAVGLWAFEPNASDRIPAVAAASGPRSTPAEYGLKVEPGDASIERGTSLLVLARFAGALPSEVRLIAEGIVDETASEAKPRPESRRVELSKSLDDPLFGGRLSEIRSDLMYHVEFDGHTSGSYRVSVFDYPALETADARIRFPEYTGMEEALIEDARQVSMVEGSTVTLDCRMNKPLAEARLVDGDGTAIPLQAVAGAENVYRAVLEPATTTRYRLELVDREGRSNKDQPEFTITVLPNRRPELKVAFPARDVRVSPLEELQVEAKAWDDFGLTQFGVVYHLAGKEPQTVVLGEAAPGKQNQPIEHVVSFEQLQAQPDQLLSYYFFADDVGPNGQSRRTFSDMYFAEVRPFEEIFREGQQQSQQSQSQQQQQQGEGGGQAQQAEKLAELQKQIINATWKLIRRETAPKPTEQFAPDATLLQESQDDALAQARELAEKLTDPQSVAFIEDVLRHMTDAGGYLGEAANRRDVEPLNPALASAQSAYQALLRLRAREHEVVRSQDSGGGGGGGGGGRNQQQLQQLSLSNQEDRYQTQREAANREQNASANREQLQVLNRLRELARRQSDVNERLKELENSLREAQTEEEQEEIRRQLKRLREEQQELLRDVDQLRNRMDQPENQSQMAESRRQLDQTRERVQQASEALQEGRTSQALSAGTRAERELQQLRDDFRNKTAGQFDDAMQDLREQARELAQQQEELGERLQALDGEQRRTLRTSRERDEIEGGLRRQKDQLEEILEQTRQVIQQAETAEPLLSKQLYETVRKTRERQPDDALDITSQLLRRGLLPEAQETEKRARQGIDELRRGVEQAAEGVLGNEVDALKRAGRELRELTEALENELAQADPEGAANAGRRSASRTGERAGESRDGEREASDPASRGERAAEDDGDPQRGSGRSSRGERNDEEADADAESGRSRRDSQNESQWPGGRRGSSEEDSERSDAQRGQSGRGGQDSDSEESPTGRQPAEGEPSGQGSSQRGSSPGGRGENRQGAEDQTPQERSQDGGSSGGQEGEPSEGQQPSGQQSPDGQSSGQQSGGGLRGGSRQRDGNRGGEEGALSSFLTQAGADRTGGGGNNRGPLTGEDFQNWSDRLRDVEEMVEDPRLRADVADIRDRARSMRAEFIRHSKEPQWDLVRATLYEPLVELQTRLAEEIARKESHDALVPLDRDPIPDRYQELVRRYYERLGGVSP
jgi:hypothetical protein